MLPRLLPRLIAPLVCLALALWTLYPTWLQPDTLIVGQWTHPDCLSNHWLLGWVADQLLAGESVLHNDSYYWPVGDAPVQAGNAAEGFLYTPFHALLGWPAGSNLYLLFVVLLNGLSGLALARAAGADRWSAMVGGAVMVCFPYTLHELSAGRFSQVSVCWAVFFLAAWIRLLEAPTMRRGLLAGASMAATAFFYWYYAFFAALGAAMLLLGRAERGWRVPWAPLAVSVASAAVLLLPWGAVFWSYWSSIPGTDGAFPSPHSFLKAAPLTPRGLIGGGEDFHHAMAPALYAAGLLGAGVAIARARRWWIGRGLLLCWGLLALLSLGPMGWASPFELIYGLAPPLRRFWWPLRHVVIVNAAWAALAAAGVSALAARLPRPTLAAALLALGLSLSAPLTLHAQLIASRPLLTAVALPPPIYPKLADAPGGVMIELPLQPRLASAQQTLIYQRYHRQRLLNGHALWADSIRPPAWDAFVADNSFLSMLQAFELGSPDGAFRFAGQDLQDLIDAGVIWLSLNREYFPLHSRPLGKSYRKLGDALFGDPVYRMQGLWIWDMRNWTGATLAGVPPWSWPAGLVPAENDMPLNDRFPPSLSFSRYEDPAMPKLGRAPPKSQAPAGP